MYKNIIFDMGGVLIDFDPKRIVDKLDLSEEEKTLFVDKVLSGSYKWYLYDTGYYKTFDDYFTDYKKDIPEPLWNLAYEVGRYWWKIELKPVDGMAKIVKDLKDNGYNLYLLSNAGTNHDEYWNKIPGHEYFDGLFVSAVEKKFKPCLDAFTGCLEKFTLKPSECIFIDDRQANCASAAMVGIKPIVFKNSRQLRSELEAAISMHFCTCIK